jgi:hypothetical protein
MLLIALMRLYNWQQQFVCLVMRDLFAELHIMMLIMRLLTTLSARNITGRQE